MSGEEQTTQGAPQAREEKKGGGKAAAAALIGTLLTAGAGVAAGWIGRGLMPQQKMTPPQMPAQDISVAVTCATNRPYNKPLRFVAHAEAMQEVDLLPQVDGYIKKLHFSEGSTVKAGELLYELDDERYQAVVRQREADLEAAKAEQRRADRYLERTRKAEAGVIPDSERDNAEAKADSAKAAVLQAEANLVVARYDLKKAKVYAPISGQIGKSNAYVGDYVSPAKGALARIVQIDPIRVTFPMTDRSYIAWRKARSGGGGDGGFRLRLKLPDGSDYAGQGKWDFDDNAMSAETATISMRLSFPNPERLLVPNSYVTLLTDYSKPPEYTCVPQSAIIDAIGGGVQVYVLKDDMTVEPRAVKTLDMHEGWVPVLEGVKAGERVVTSGVGKLGPGKKVRLAEATPNEDTHPGYVRPSDK